MQMYSHKKTKLLRVCVFLRLPYISAAQLRLGACAEGHIDRAMLVTAKGVCLMLTMCEIALNPKYKYNLLAHVKTSWSAK